MERNPINEITGSMKFWRQYRNLTQAGLAKECGVTVQTIANLENGKYPISKPMLITIATVLKINKEQIALPYELAEA